MTTKAPVFYLFASGAGQKPSQSSATVFYKVEGEALAESLCGLFTKEYGDTNGHTAFHHVAAASISEQDQVLLDETIECLEVYKDPDPGLYDPQPTADIIARAQCAVRARSWEQLLRGYVYQEVTDKKQNPKVDDGSKQSATDRPPEISAEDWRNSGLNLLMLLAQAYYKILESACGVPCAAVDLELNHSYLWVVNSLTKLLATHEDLSDFPMKFAPYFENLFPSNISDVDWEDMVAPEAEQFLGTVQEYVIKKGMFDPEHGSPAWVFLEILRPSVISAIEHAVAYQKSMSQSMQKILKSVSQTAAGRFASGIVPSAPAAAESKPNEQPKMPTPPGKSIPRAPCQAHNIGNVIKQIKFRDRIYNAILLNRQSWNILQNEYFSDQRIKDVFLTEFIIDQWAIEIRPYEETDELLLYIMLGSYPAEIVKYNEWRDDECQFEKNGWISPVNKKTGLPLKSSEHKPDYVGFYDIGMGTCLPSHFFPPDLTREDVFGSFPSFDYILLPIPIRCTVRDLNAEEKLLLKQHHEHIGSKARPVQSTEERVEKRLRVAIELVRTLEEQIKNEQMGKPEISKWKIRRGEDGKLHSIIPHPELVKAKANLEILMFHSGVYKEAQRRNTSLQAELYETDDEDRKAVLESAIEMQCLYTREILQEIHSTPDHGERECIMLEEEVKEMDHEEWKKRDAKEMAEVARMKREKEEQTKKEAADKLREIAESVRAVGQRQAELARQLQEDAPHVEADRNKAQLAWIHKVEGCTEIERKTALLRTDGMTLTEIAKRLPHKNGKPMTRQGVKQALIRFETKSGQRGLFARGTYRQNTRIESEAKEADADGEDKSDR